MVLPTITQDTIDLSPGDELILRFRTWEDYENLLSRRQDKAGLRIRYDGETRELRIMSPLPKQGNIAGILADLVKVLLRHLSKDWQAYTPITLKQASKQGIEPDYCFCVQNWQRILGKEEIDLEVDPPPDWVIEVDLTSATKPEHYQAIGAKELWIYRHSQLRIYLFNGQQYQESQTSLQFPNFDLKTLIPKYVDRGWQLSSSIALREFEQFLQEDN